MSCSINAAISSMHERAPAGWRPRRGGVNKTVYRENINIIPREKSNCKGVA